MPLHEPSPYEVLGLPLTADAGEIKAAEASASKSGRYARQQIQQSSKLLRNADWRLEIDVQQPLPPDSADKALDLLAPLLAEPLWAPGRPPLPPVTTLMTLHRGESEAEFAEPPVIGLGDEPEIPSRVTAGLSVLPHVEFPA